MYDDDDDSDKICEKQSNYGDTTMVMK